MMHVARQLACAFVVATVLVLPAQAGDIVADWASVKTPPAPELKPVTVDPKTTALLVIDMIKQTCNEKMRPRCVAAIPKIENYSPLHARAASQ